MLQLTARCLSPLCSALMAEWFKVLPLNAHCLNIVRVPITVGACENVASDLGLGSGFRWALRYRPPLTTGYSRLNNIYMAKVAIT